MLLFVGIIFLWFRFLSYSKALRGGSGSVLRIHVLSGIRSYIFCLDGVICPEPRVCFWSAGEPEFCVISLW